MRIGSFDILSSSFGALSLESAGWEGGRLLPGTGYDKILYHITDHLGSVRVVKDGTGAVLQRFDYYPFGCVSGSWSSSTNPSQPSLRYRFSGKEIAGQIIDASLVASALAGTPAAAAGTPYLDFGARLYDPRSAAWLSQDPMAEKYYGISPYAYCDGNPVNLVDPEGEAIRIYYGKDNQYSFYYDGTQEIIPENKYVQAVIEAYKYNKANWEKSKNQDKCPSTSLVEGDFEVSVYMSMTRHDLYERQNGGKQTIIWNPREGLETTNGIILSPATLFSHEADHAIDDATKAAEHADRVSAKNKDYDNEEEYRVITGSEQNVARANGEIKGKQVTRKNHGGDVVLTAGVTSTIVIKRKKTD